MVLWQNELISSVRTKKDSYMYQYQYYLRSLWVFFAWLQPLLVSVHRHRTVSGNGSSCSALQPHEPDLHLLHLLVGVDFQLSFLEKDSCHQ